MARTPAPLGIKKIEAIHYYVNDLERSRAFYTKKLDFAEVEVSHPALNQVRKQRSAVFQAGECNVIVSEPIGEGGRAWRWLRKHPAGVGAVVFEVEDIERTFRLLDRRGGTPIDEIQTFESDGATLKTFSITTPFGSSTFRFVQRDAKYPTLMPGSKRHRKAKGGKNKFGFTHFDHVTSNFETMSPAILWLKHVFGCEDYWSIEFHTNDVDENTEQGSGLRSKVVWEKESGVKFANNEPMRPFFKESQINIFAEDNRGDGIQHCAIAVADIIPAVKGLRRRGVSFMKTPGTYYDMLPERINKSGIKQIDENVDVLRKLGILIDGEARKKYLLQIFLEDSAQTHGDADAGPFFFEVIQRKGDKGFGGGNFRALFESIERQQVELIEQDGWDGRSIGAKDKKGKSSKNGKSAKGKSTKNGKSAKGAKSAKGKSTKNGKSAKGAKSSKGKSSKGAKGKERKRRSA